MDPVEFIVIGALGNFMKTSRLSYNLFLQAHTDTDTPTFTHAHVGEKANITLHFISLTHEPIQKAHPRTHTHTRTCGYKSKHDLTFSNSQAHPLMHTHHHSHIPRHTLVDSHTLEHPHPHTHAHPSIHTHTQRT